MATTIGSFKALSRHRNPDRARLATLDNHGICRFNVFDGWIYVVPVTDHDAPGMLPLAGEERWICVEQETGIVRAAGTKQHCERYAPGGERYAQTPRDGETGNSIVIRY